MSAKSEFQILDNLAAEHIPPTSNLAPRILAVLEPDHGVKPMHPKMKLATTLLIVTIAILAITSIAYALYRWIGDPGLQSVEEAGLLTDLGVTAQPTILPTPTSPASSPAAAQLGESQSLAGISLTLDWAYLDESRLALGMSYSTLPPDLTLGSPVVTFVGITPIQALGWSQSLRTNQNRAEYISYQVIQSASVGDKVDLEIEVPILPIGGESPLPLATFHFTIHDLKVYKGQTLPIQQTYAVRVNGVEIRLKSVRVTPSASEVIACYDFPTSAAPFWYMQHATVQIGEGPEEGYRTYRYLGEEPIQSAQDHCVQLGFPVGNAQGEKRMIFRVRQLVVPLTMQDRLPPERIAAANQELARSGIEIAPASPEESDGPGGWKFIRRPSEIVDPAQDPTLIVIHTLEESASGPWEFYIDIPDASLQPGRAAPEPTSAPTRIGSQSVGDVNVTLDWAFADAKRVAVGYTVRGLPDISEATELLGWIDLAANQGVTLPEAEDGASTITRLENEPGVLQGTWSVVYAEPLSMEEIDLHLEITLDNTQRNQIIAPFPFPPEATPYPPGIFPPTLPDKTIGTFSFDFTAPVYPLQISGPLPAVAANGIEMWIERVELTPSFSSFTLCYPKPTPSDKDWWTGRATLKAGNTEVQNSSGRLLYDQDIAGMHALPTEIAARVVAHGRCVSLNFLLGHANQASFLTLTILNLEQSMPENILESDMRAAQEKLKAQGIEVSFMTASSAGGGGGGGYVFTHKPEGMDQDTAYQRLMEALGAIHTGPWVFTIEAQP
jgi:hypothetical protein